MRGGSFNRTFEVFGEEKRALAKLPHIKSVLRYLNKALVPSTDEEVMYFLERLQTRYHATLENNEKNEAIRDMLDDEDLEDASEFPPDLIAKACKNWRMDPSREWAPRDIGTLMGSVMREYNQRIACRRKAEQIIAMLEEK